MAGKPLAKPVVGIARTADGGGYWLVAADGGVFSFGDAGFHGSMGGKPLAAPVVGMAAAPDGNGYWLAGSDGGVFSFGDAAFHGSLAGKALAKPVTGIAATPDGKGYWLVAADGGVFNFGDAGFYGSLGNVKLNAPIVGIAPTPDGKGYWLVGSDGGVFSFGDAGFHGSAASLRLDRPVSAIASTPSGQGYWLTGQDGGVFSFGDAAFEGSLPALGVKPAPLPAPPAAPGQVPTSAGGAPDGIPPVYVPMYQEDGAAYGVNWYLIASIHEQETNFSRSQLPGVSSGVNAAGCCAGPTQFDVVGSSPTWLAYENAFAPLAGLRPSAYPLQSGVTVCLPGGGHPCVYDDFDALAATADLLHASGANDDLASAATYAAVAHYGGVPPYSDAYADQVIARAEAWQRGQAAVAAARFGATVYSDPTITVTQTGRGAAVAARSRRHERRHPRLHFLVRYRGRLAAARRDFGRFLRAFHYRGPGRLYAVSYRQRHPRRR
jgi:hypothetical protein